MSLAAALGVAAEVMHAVHRGVHARAGVSCMLHGLRQGRQAGPSRSPSSAAASRRVMKRMMMVEVGGSLLARERRRAGLYLSSGPSQGIEYEPQVSAIMRIVAQSRAHNFIEVIRAHITRLLGRMRQRCMHASSDPAGDTSSMQRHGDRFVRSQRPQITHKIKHKLNYMGREVTSAGSSSSQIRPPYRLMVPTR